MDAQTLTHLSKDPIFKKLIGSIQLEPLSPRGSLYEALIRAIVYQQLSGKAAGTIHGRFLDLFADGIPYPAEVLSFDIPTLRGAGLSRQKAGYIQNVAEFFVQEKLENKEWDEMENDAIVDYLTQIKGVGKWTVQMILMFTLHRPDVFPTDDLGIQQAIMGLYGFEAKGKEMKKRMLEISEAWRPYRTHACRYLWRWKDGE